MADWVRKTFDSIGVTQAPPGPYLPALQEPHYAHVVLCIDVSGSMAHREGGRSRLEHAQRGAERFVAEAVQAHYRVGLILWDHGISGSVPLDRDPEPVLRGIRTARISGGTDVCPALRLGVSQLAALTNDRVLAIFGDGELGNPRLAKRLATEAAEQGIRIITRGLGKKSGAALAAIATEADAAGTVTSGSAIEEGIASMATRLRRLRSPVTRSDS